MIQQESEHVIPAADHSPDERCFEGTTATIGEAADELIVPYARGISPSN